MRRLAPVTIDRDTKIEILRKVAALGARPSINKLDEIARSYGLTFPELGSLVEANERVQRQQAERAAAAQRTQRSPRQPVPPSRPAAEVPAPASGGPLGSPDSLVSDQGLESAGSAPRPGQVTEPGGVPSKACTACGETKRLTEFYAQASARDGRGSQCRACNDRRDPSAAKLVRNRARTRATSALVKAHEDEFKRLMKHELTKAIDEHQRLVAEAVAKGQTDAEVARLKPGPKRDGQTDVTERLDVARCSVCHTHHDEDHVCPGCGDQTGPEVHQVKPYVIREWAVREGLAPVPTRGPLPERITAAYAAAHPDQFPQSEEETRAS